MQCRLAKGHPFPAGNPVIITETNLKRNQTEQKMSFNPKYAILLLPLALAACSSMPSGPNVMVLPGNGKSLEQFQADDFFCRQYASMQIGANANDAAVSSGVKTAALGTALGAASGALIDGGHGATVGAGAGLLIGGVAGAGASSTTGYEAQIRYDNAYQQCMYAKGNSIPVTTNYSRTKNHGNPSRQNNYGPPPDTTSPPPAKYVVPGK